MAKELVKEILTASDTSANLHAAFSSMIENIKTDIANNS